MDQDAPPQRRVCQAREAPYTRTMLRPSHCLAWAALCIIPLISPAQAAGTPRFTSTKCELPDTVDVLPRLRCGVVRVPRDYAKPDGATFALAVVVIASAQPPAHTDPVVYISGGPGGPLTIYAGFQARHPYAADRDLILIDQRGMGRSEPHLCPDLQADLVERMLAVVADPTPEALSADRAAHAACHDEIVAQGIDPDAFGTAVTVEDFELVRQALGVARWNVVGESYGTTVAMTLLATHPESVRSAVLDSLNPPDIYFGMPWSDRVARARDAFISACAENTLCEAAHSDLAGLYRKTIARLAQAPRLVPLPADVSLPGKAVRLTPSLFEAVIGRLVYYPTAYSGLPHLIAAASENDFEPVGDALASLLAQAKRNGNEGAFTAVECRDRPHWREPAQPSESALDLALLPPGICPAWSPLGPEPTVPNGSAVPTLVLAGQFDPNIGPEQSRHVADLLGPRARWIEFAGIGHNVRHFSPCAQRLVADFIDKPDRALDTTCATIGPAHVEPHGPG